MLLLCHIIVLIIAAASILGSGMMTGGILRQRWRPAPELQDDEPDLEPEPWVAPLEAEMRRVLSDGAPPPLR